jgi:hypothetical protein
VGEAEVHARQLAQGAVGQLGAHLPQLGCAAEEHRGGDRAFGRREQHREPAGLLGGGRQRLLDQRRDAGSYGLAQQGAVLRRGGDDHGRVGPGQCLGRVP